MYLDKICIYINWKDENDSNAFDLIRNWSMIQILKIFGIGALIKSLHPIFGIGAIDYIIPFICMMR